MAIDGRWLSRFKTVAEALQGVAYSETRANEDWDAVRLHLPARQAYVDLVDKYHSAAEATVAPSSPRGDAVSEGVVVGKQLLPAWCLAREGSARHAARVAAASRADDAAILTGPEPDGEEEPPAERTPLVDPKHRATLWIGDIPAESAEVKALNRLLYKHKPRYMPTPFVKKLVKQGYRAEASAEATEGDSPEGKDGTPAPRQRQKPPWLGFAFVEFRDTAEAEEALAHFLKLEADGCWSLRAQWAEEKHQARTTQFRRLGPRLRAGENPPLGEQLFPTSFYGDELCAALERHSRATRVRVAPTADIWVRAEVIKSHYRLRPRKEVSASGVPLPPSLTERLLSELRGTRWPAAPQRSGMQADNYLVIQRGGNNDGYEDLHNLLCEVMVWADPKFGCNRIAVTRDFQGSPHIDASDTTYQYAISLGDFSAGGQLCVEGASADEVWVVDTHNRIAKIDGRFVHWVRGHEGGERFSLIFFSTDPACSTEKLTPFYADFVPHGEGIVGSTPAGLDEGVETTVNH